MMFIEDKLSDLLFELYRRKSKRSESFESDDTFASSNSYYHFDINFYDVPTLNTKSIQDTRKIILDLHKKITMTSEKLMKCLKKREKFRIIVLKNYDLITAILQAYSPKRRIDTKMKFSVSPLENNDLAYNQWLRALKSVIRMPDGIPADFRQQLSYLFQSTMTNKCLECSYTRPLIWLNLADHHICSLDIQWDNVKGVCFNEATNPDDYDLDAQIIKDLHRTNSSGVSGTTLSEDERILLKRVLLAFARWNKKIGYCQGLNVIAALLLEIMDYNEEHALKVMIYMVDHILPPRYYTSNLSSLTIDMSVFSELLESHLPHLSDHLEKIRKTVAKYDIYEPPLTNLFTMQWFLTLFATWFPRHTVLKIWDSLLIHGSEVLLRAALIFWKKIDPLLFQSQNPDQYYSVMDAIAKKCATAQIISSKELIDGIYSLGPFPSKVIQDLRDKYTYNISPFTNPVNRKHSKTPGNNLKIFDLTLPDFIKFSNKKPGSTYNAAATCCQINAGKMHVCSRKSVENGGDGANQKEIEVLSRGNLCDIKALRSQYKTICQQHEKSLLIISAFPGTPSQTHKKFQRNKDNGQGVEDVIINHLYIKPGPRAKHKKNRKEIIYSS